MINPMCVSKEVPADNDSQDFLCKLALSMIDKVGAVTARSLVSYCGSVTAVFQASRRELLKIPGVGPRIVDQILKGDFWRKVEEEAKFMEKYGIQLLFYTDSRFPQRLQPYHDAPLLLFYKGQANLNTSRVVAIIGTRKPSERGRVWCESLVDGLKEFGVTVVSGLAYGIDITAHRQCVKRGISTIGVLGNGLGSLYPSAHHSTAQRMLEYGGLLSEYSSQVGPDREHFPMRNRIIAGMCDALVVVESGQSGGSMITAEFANAYNKDVFALPGRVTDPLSMGCNKLIKTHKAALIESAEDIAYIMRWDRFDQSRAHQQSLFVELSENEKQVLQILENQEQASSVDALCREMKVRPSSLSSLLLSLEFKGLIKSLPGNRFVRI